MILAISLVGTAVSFDSLTNAFGITGPTVTPVPASGTYRAVQSGTLIASTPSTIYYTTDGTTPTTSSTNGPSPRQLYHCAGPPRTILASTDSLQRDTREEKVTTSPMKK